MVFSGCPIAYGTATAVVAATGMAAEMGKTAVLLDNEEPGLTQNRMTLAKAWAA